MSTSFTDHDDTREHHVYRVYSADDTLLYIGCAYDVLHRIYMHINASNDGRPSAPVAYLYHRHTEQGPYATKAEARKAEISAIATEAPLLNRQHNKKCFRFIRGQGYVRTDGRTVPSWADVVMRHRQPASA